MNHVLLVFGTRPEAIKMCPLIKELQCREKIRTTVCVTGQHRQMLDQVLRVFGVIPEYDLSIMKENQTLFDITINVLDEFKKVLQIERPDIVLVHGDTTTTFSAALACYYLKIPVGHIEAGLRTYDIFSPYPEEFNRQSVSILAKYHFAPTRRAYENLIKEGKNKENVFITGNTVIDALNTTVRSDYHHTYLDWAEGSRLLLMTVHRRESFGEPMKNIFSVINSIVSEYTDVKVIYPVHKNPLVRKMAESILGDNEKVKIIDPLDVLDFHNFMSRSYIILTDSGGIQEEAPSLGKPVLVLRNTTERPEGIKAGTLILAGTEPESIYNKCKALLDDKKLYMQMSKAVNPYGDGHAAERIADEISRI